MTFDTMKMGKRFIEAGFDRRQSEALTEGLREGQMELATKADLLATKTELKVEIANLKYQLLLGVAAMLGVAVALMKWL